MVCGHVSVACAEESSGVIDPAEIEALFDAYISENDLDPELISVAYIYTGTEEHWYHLEDKWYYSASLYKVPLAMLLAEKVYNGEMTQESEIYGMTLESIEEEILTNSNNPIAYSMLLYLGEPDQSRRLFCRYSDLPEDYYSWDFYGSSCFTARYMSDVLFRLYRQPEMFPNVTDCLKRAQPGHYFRLRIGDEYEIAQKYGYYCEEDGSEWSHTAGIVFTPVPFILTVMTRYGGIGETIIADLAAIFCDYTLLLDERIPETETIDDQSTNFSAETEANEEYSSDQAVEKIPDPVIVPSEEPDAQMLEEQTESVQGQAADSRLCLIAAVSVLVLLLTVMLIRKKNRQRPSKRSKQRRSY